MYTDASRFCLGVVLAQVQVDGKEHVISYASRLMIPAERKYPITDKEGLAVIFAVKSYRHYLIGKRFTLIKDHSALKALKNKTERSGRLERWA